MNQISNHGASLWRPDIPPRIVVPVALRIVLLDIRLKLLIVLGPSSYVVVSASSMESREVYFLMTDRYVNLGCDTGTRKHLVRILEVLAESENC